MKGMSLADLLPKLDAKLRLGEVILFNNLLDAVTVLDGEGGFLSFRRWEMKKNFADHPQGENAHWELMEEFTLGSQARVPLVEMLERAWSGCIISEAATVFKNGEACIEQGETVELALARAWVDKTVRKMLEEEEEISQAVVIGPGGRAFELTPDTWGSDKLHWEDVSDLEVEKG